MPPEGTVKAERLILGLFIALAAATAIALLWFIQITEQRLAPVDFARIKWRLYGALLGDLLAPVVAWFVIKAINQRRAI
ncbi:MAG TPA: hypothetical protein VM286_09180 [Candidatus Thermoplasmatota archaeon]|nr:hypothetical protein [Candidatus Thermoplasmatota archaeon]